MTDLEKVNYIQEKIKDKAISWDKLMGYIEWIEMIKVEDNYVTVHISGNDCMISVNGLEFVSKKKLKRSQVLDILEQFINWYKKYEGSLEDESKLVINFLNIKNTGLEGYYQIFPNGFYKIDEFSYHTSWDWLIPLVHEVVNNSYKDNVTENFKYFIFNRIEDNNIKEAYNNTIHCIKYLNTIK